MLLVWYGSGVGWTGIAHGFSGGVRFPMAQLPNCGGRPINVAGFLNIDCRDR